MKKKKDNRRVAIPQSQDNDKEPGDDSAAKHVETKPIRQEHVEPDSGVLDETIARNLAPGPPSSPSEVLLCHYDEEEGVWKKISISEKALPHHLEQHKMDALPGGTILTSDCEAKPPDTCTKFDAFGCESDSDCCLCKCSRMFCFSELSMCMSNSLFNIIL